MDRVLVVEANPEARMALLRSLQGAGDNETQTVEVDAAASAEEGIASLRDRHPDVIVCNSDLPGVDGLELLRQVRLQDLDVPIVLLTDSPSVTVATRALEYGAYRYLHNPPPEEVLRTVAEAIRFHQLARTRRQALELLGGSDMSLGDRAGLEARFERALQGLTMAFQPVVEVKARKLIGYEALLRSNEPTMNTPQLFFDAAQRLRRVRELGRAIRAEVTRRAAEAPPGTQLFVNVHASDLLDEASGPPTPPSAPSPTGWSSSCTERASFDEILGVAERVSALRKLGFRIAIDDMGAGYAGLSTLSQLRPEIVKIDMSLIRGIDADPVKRSIVSSLTQLCRELQMVVVAEGVETAEECTAVSGVGCDYMQGYLFGRPALTFAPPNFG